MNPELLDYLKTMITPGEAQGVPDAVFLHVVAGQGFDWSVYADQSVHAIVMEGSMDAQADIEQAFRALKPGGHLMLQNPEEEPTGFTGACMAEDVGFEVRDCILVPDQAGDGDRLHYVAKASRGEREEGLSEQVVSPSLPDVEDEEGDEVGPKGKKRFNSHPCLHPESLVLTDRGFRPIAEVSIGDNVYSADGKFHAVEHVSRHPYTSPDLFEIKVMGTNYTTQASDNHPFLIYRPTRKGAAIRGGEVMWLRADQIQVGDYTMTPQLAEPLNDVVFDPDWWFVFGLWVAEGVAHRAGHGDSLYPSFTLHEKETGLLDRIRSVFHSVNVGVYPKKGTKAIQVVVFDRIAGARFVELAGRGASTKRLHPSVWGLPKKIRASLLAGYLAGDGGNVRNYIQAKTVSPDLASQMQLLASSVGYKVSLLTFPPVEGCGIGGRLFKSVQPVYHLHIYSKNSENVTSGTRKASRPTEIIHEGVPFSLAYVKRVVRIPYVGDVVNLSVEGSPTFQTAVGMSHNTVKPKAVMERLLMDVPKDRGPVVDPFLGSGTTGIACVATGHDFIGIEREREYMQIADARIRHWATKIAGWNAPEVVSDLSVDPVGVVVEETPVESKPVTAVLTFEDLF